MNKQMAVMLFRILALCTAVGLGGTYVWKRQKQAAPPVTAPVEQAAPAPIVVDAEETRTLMPGSKAGIFVERSEPGVHQLEQEKQRVLLPGSKSYTRIFPPDLLDPAEEPEPEQPEADEP